MKILVITPYLGLTYGGISKVVTETIQSLNALDVSVDLITTNANGPETLDVLLNVWMSERGGHRVQYFPCWHRNDFIISPSLLQWLFLNVFDYDIVHLHTLFSPFISLACCICQVRQVPYIMTPHGMLESRALSYKAWKKRLYYALLEKSVLRHGSVIQSIAKSEADHIQALGFQAVVIVPNGLHRKEFELLPKPKLFYHQFPQTKNKTLLLFLGRIDPMKGLDLLASAFATIHKQFPQTHLVIAGPDTIGFLDTVQSYFIQSGCLDAVTFTGMLAGTLKYAALAAASLYVSPSYSEGFSMSVLEGMAAGLPCIMTTGCNFPEAASAQVAHVVDSDIDKIAEALIHCLNHPLEAKAMGDRARQFIFQHYTWEQSAQKLKAVYQAIIDRKPLSEHLNSK